MVIQYNKKNKQRRERNMKPKYLIIGGIALAAGFVCVMVAGTAGWLVMSHRPARFDAAQFAPQMAAPGAMAGGMPGAYPRYSAPNAAYDDEESGFSGYPGAAAQQAYRQAYN